MTGRVVFCTVMLLAYVSNTFGQVAENDQPRIVQPALPSSPAVNLAPNLELVPAKSEQDSQDGQAQKEAGGQDKLAALEKTVTELSKKLTVVTDDENFKLILGGAITADFLFNSARPVAPGVPFFLTPGPVAGFNQDTFDATARQTTLVAAISGPKICDFQSGGLITLTLYNDSVIVDRYGILPILAYADLKNEDWRFAAGLQFDIFNPLNPNVLPFSRLGASGNAGAYRGQARIERYLRPSDDAQVTLTVGISDPVPTILTPNLELTEDNGWPNVEGRAALALGPLIGEGPLATRPFEWGVSGLVGQLRTTETATQQVVANVWGLGTDLRWAITPRFGMQGELFIGESLGTYAGGILQSVNAVTKAGVRDSGGWVELYYYLCPEKLHAHIGYGIDDPLDRDLAPGQAVRNDTYFANLIWDVMKQLRLAGEVTFRKTSYIAVPNNDGIGFQTQVQLKF